MQRLTELISREDYISAVAPEGLEVGEDRVLFPEGVLLPVSVRATQALGQSSAWCGMTADVFTGQPVPLLYSIAFRREAPDVLRGKLRARRTLLEGLLLAAAEKTGRRPSFAEQAADSALDAAESQLSFGKPAFKTALMTGLFAARGEEARAEAGRRSLEGVLRARGLVPQRLIYTAERALYHFQPGGFLFTGLDQPVMLLEDALPLVPHPSRPVLPGQQAVWLGSHSHNGRDVYFDMVQGLDPSLPPAPHAMTLILGEMGAGKTSLMRLILLQRLLQGRAVVTIDPEGENNPLCRAMGGRVVPAGIPADADTCLLHPLQGNTPAEVLFSAGFLVAALGLELSPTGHAALHEAVRRRWERRPGWMTVTDLMEALGALHMAEASILIALLRPYASGGLLDGFFDRPKALLSAEFPPGGWWNFDLSALREENRNLVHAVLTWFLYHAVTHGVHPLDIFIDEGWRLMRSVTFTMLLDELGRRARKRGIGVVLSTHLPGDLSRGCTALSLASSALIGRMGPEEAQSFFYTMGIPEGEARRQAEFVSRLAPRQFLAAQSGGRGGLFPLSVSIPPVWLELFRQLEGGK